MHFTYNLKVCQFEYQIKNHPLTSIIPSLHSLILENRAGCRAFLAEFSDSHSIVITKVWANNGEKDIHNDLSEFLYAPKWALIRVSDFTRYHDSYQLNKTSLTSNSKLIMRAHISCSTRLFIWYMYLYRVTTTKHSVMITSWLPIYGTFCIKFQVLLKQSCPSSLFEPHFQTALMTCKTVQVHGFSSHPRCAFVLVWHNLFNNAPLQKLWCNFSGFGIHGSYWSFESKAQNKF